MEPAALGQPSHACKIGEASVTLTGYTACTNSSVPRICAVLAGRRGNKASNESPSRTYPRATSFAA